MAKDMIKVKQLKTSQQTNHVKKIYLKLHIIYTFIQNFPAVYVILHFSLIPLISSTSPPAFQHTHIFSFYFA